MFGGEALPSLCLGGGRGGGGLGGGWDDMTMGHLPVCVGCSKPMRGNDEVVIASGPKTWASRMEKSTRLSEGKKQREQFTDSGQGRSCWGLDCFYRPVIDARAVVVGHSSLLASKVPRPSLPWTRVISAGAGQSRRRWRRQAGICPTHCVLSLFPQLHRHHLSESSFFLSFCRGLWQEGSLRVRGTEKTTIRRERYGLRDR